MSQGPLQPISPVIDTLLAVERELIPESDEFRSRQIERARAALRLNPWIGDPSSVTTSQRLTLRWIVAAIVTLSALSAAAFFAGYSFRLRSSAVSSSMPKVVQSDVAPTLSATALVSAATTQSEPTLDETHPIKPKTVGLAKPASDMEAYAMELQLLQPARQAVARQDFASALAAIATHQRRFPSGKLTEEREAMRVKALLGLGRVAEAQSAGAAFRARFPRSALLGRIDAMLESGK